MSLHLLQWWERQVRQRSWLLADRQNNEFMKLQNKCMALRTTANKPDHMLSVALVLKQWRFAGTTNKTSPTYPATWVRPHTKETSRHHKNAAASPPPPPPPQPPMVAYEADTQWGSWYSRTALLQIQVLASKEELYEEWEEEAEVEQQTNRKFLADICHNITTPVVWCKQNTKSDKWK
jgi:hypothetical protein